MEFSFGDEFKDGPLTLGMHKKGHHHDVVNVPFCHLVDEDFRLILTSVLDFAAKYELIKYNKRSNIGFLRHLVVRKSKGTGEIMVALSATTQAADLAGNPFNQKGFVEMLKALKVTGEISSILYVKNDGLGDVVTGEIEVLSGRDFIVEKLFELSFKITLYSFFQTNTLGAERLYDTAMQLIPDLEGKICFDLFSGTGTIGQIMAQKAKRVIGIEWVEDAVMAARENTGLNGLDNCEFICGDVFAKLSTIEDHPDVIVVDPPRSGMGEKTTRAIASYGIPEIVYVSCNPSTLMDDLTTFDKCGYVADEITLVDMFPWTGGVESVVLIKKIG
jgi:23S rRNA (uracil-5-)-methyltransferase RumA